MSTVGDENAGPGVSLKGAGGSQDGPPSSALKQSNKANILSPPPSPRKKLDRGDGLAPEDGTLRKENLDQTVTVDASVADDDDIISFRGPDSLEAEGESEVDPFKPRTQLTNSPVLNGKQTLNDPVGPTVQSAELDGEQDSHCKENGAPSCSSSSEETAKIEDASSTVEPLAVSNPFQPQSQLMNSPPVKTSECTSHVQDGASQNAGDSAKPSEKMEGSHTSDKEPGEPVASNGSDKPEFLETKVCEEVSGEVDPFKASSQLANTPPKPVADVDPFKPRTQIANSPITAADDPDPFKPGTQLSNSPEKVDAVLDPFQPKNQLTNSPGKSTEKADLQTLQLDSCQQKVADMATEAPIHPQPPANSVDTEADLVTADSKQQSVSGETHTDLTDSSSQTVQSAGLSDRINGEALDPFKPQNAMANSLENASSENNTALDPFEPKTQLANSPSGAGIQEGMDPFQPKTQLANSPSGAGILEGMDPFQPKTQLTNSPGGVGIQEEMDPFQPKTQLTNSPGGVGIQEEMDPFQPKTQLANSPGGVGIQEEMDPFQPKTQLTNSPSGAGIQEEMDPFQPKTQLANSPGRVGIQEGMDPFQPKTQLANPPGRVGIQEEMDPFQPKTQLANPPGRMGIQEGMDPFKPKTRLANSSSTSVSSDTGTVLQQDADLKGNDSEKINSPEKKEDVSNGKPPLSNSSEKKEDVASEVDPFKPRAQLVNSPSKADTAAVKDVDPFKPKAQLVNSPVKPSVDEVMDPFKPEAQRANSPAKDIDPVNSMTQMTDSLARNEASEAEIDPFKSKTQLANSPAKPESIDAETDPFMPKTQLANSPSKTEDINKETDPFKPSTQLVSSPTKVCVSEDTHPVEPRAQLANSPVKQSEKMCAEADPFKSKKQLANSPAKTDDIFSEVNPFQPETQLANSPAKTDDKGADPFKPKAQLANSPMKTDDIFSEVNPFQSKKQLANSPAKTDGKGADPFKPKTQLANSPAKDISGETDPFKPKAQLANSSAKDISGETDPFKAKAQLANSPAKDISGETDPFKAKVQQANFPAKDISGETDPFKAKAQLTNSPAKDISGETNPFKAKAQLANSPAKDISGETDPFEPKAQLTNSPAKDISGETDPFKPKTQLSSSPAKTEDTKAEDADPFKPRSQLSSSPEKNRADDFSNSNSSSLEGRTGQSCEGPKEGEKAKGSAGAPSQGQDGVKGMDAVSRNPILLASGQDLGLDDMMFISGTQAFSDPAAWDLLEQFGGGGETKETDLRKCSLYVKFDPLVKPTLPKTPDKMPAPAHAAPRRAAARQHDLMNLSQLNASQVNTSMQEESICLLGTPPKVSRRRSVLSQRRMNMSSVNQTITEEESVKPVDLLFSLEGDTATDDMFLNDPSKKSDGTSSTLVEVEEGAKYTETQWHELQQKLAMQYEGQMLARERRLAAQLEEKGAAIDGLQAQIDTLTAEKIHFHEKMTAMSSCVEEYEKTMNMLIVAKEKTAAESKAQIDELKKERDQALEDVQAVENSFTEFHRRYEKLKQALEGFKKNEDTLKETVKMWQDKVKASEDNLAKVKTKAEEKIKELVGSVQQKDSDRARVEAELKRTKLHVQSLESSLEQKRQENKELTELCDTLIAQVGGTGK